MTIFPSCRPVATRLLSGETAIDHISSSSSMTGPIRVSVDASRNEMERYTKVAMNFPSAGRAIEGTR